jgi:hypothetical protein
MVSREDFRLHWECPYCDNQGQNHDETNGVQQFQSHLFSHVEPLLEDGTHVARDIDGTGNIMVRAPLRSTGAENARVHFIAPGDIVLFVTTEPARRLRLIDQKMDEWPAWTIVLTTKEQPLDDVDIPKLAKRPLEVVRIDKRMGLSDLGETISRVIAEQDTTNGRVSIEFDILSEIVEKFDIETVFKFLHLLMKRLESTNTLAHYYVNPRKRSASTINIFDELFDLSIVAKENVFIANPNG